MTGRFSLPFRTSAGAEMELGAWHYRSGRVDSWIRLDDGVPGWDYLAQLAFRREVVIDGRALRSACALTPDAPLALTVTTRCAASRFRRVLFNQAVSEARHQSTVQLELPSANLAGQLRLETEIVLTQEPEKRGRFSARHPGSRLFRETASVDIEGTRSRMPIQIAKFAQQFGWLNAPNAPWHVDCGSGEMHIPVMHDLRVYLNADQPHVIDAANRGDAAVVSLLKSDIAKRILETALADESFLDAKAKFEEGTMGEAAMRILHLCFEDMRPRDVLSLMQKSGGKFEAVIRSRFNVSP